MQAKVGPTAAGRTSACPSKRGREEGRLFELGGLKLKGKSDCQIRFPLRRILRNSRRRRRQLETWDFFSVSQTISVHRSECISAHPQSISSNCMHAKTGTIIAAGPAPLLLLRAAPMISEKWSDPAVGPVTLCRQMSSRSMHCLYLDLFLWEIMGLELE